MLDETVKDDRVIKKPNCRKRNCLHFIGVYQPDNTEETETVICDAFPAGIPSDIAYGENLHEEPVKGDNGIQYEKARDKS